MPEFDESGFDEVELPVEDAFDELPPSPLEETADHFPPVVETGGLSQEERNWAIGAHLSTFVGAIAPIPLLTIVAPLAVWLMKKDSMPFVERHAREALNFNLSMFIYGLISFILIFVLIGFLLLPVVFLTWIIASIVGAVKAANGEEFRYPLTIRMVR